MMKWLKYLLLATILFTAAGHAQKLRFPTNVRYIAGGYIDKQPYFKTLEAALNNVKAYATAGNPYVFWLDSDTLQIADWDSVFTESGLTMKDSIDVYYVAEGKIKWAGFGQGGSGGGGTINISTPTGTTTHYNFWTWTGQANLYAWQTRIAQDIDSIDQRIWELIVYTDSVYLYIENDTLKFRAGSISVTGWNPDTTTVLRTTGAQSKSGNLTLLAGLIGGANSYWQLPAANYGTGGNIWKTATEAWFYTGSDSLQFVLWDEETGLLNLDSLITWQNLNAAVKDSIAMGGIATFSGTSSSLAVSAPGMTSSSIVVAIPVYADSSTAVAAEDALVVIPTTDAFYIKRSLGGTSGLSVAWTWIRKETQ